MSNKAIFLDRDDTLIEDAGYINHPDQVKLLDSVSDALRELKEMGYKLVVASNQSAVARGIVTEEVLNEIHDRLKQLLAEKGAFLDQIYYCPYHPDGIIPKYHKESDWRKPNPGMLLAAADEMDIDLSQSWCIGNGSRDVEAGLRAGCKTILIDHSPYPKQSEPVPDYRAVNIKEAVNIIKMYHRRSSETVTKTEPNSIPQTEPVPNATEAVLQVAEPVAQTAEPVVEAGEPVLEAVEEPPQPELTEPQPDSAEQESPADKTLPLLDAILGQLKSMQRANMFGGEFSITRLMAGIVQIVVLFCLLVTIWFLMSPTRQDNSVFIALGFAAVLQMMALTLYIMQERK